MAHNGAYWSGPHDRDTFLGGSYDVAHRGYPGFANVWIYSEDRYNIGAFPAGDNPIHHAPFDNGPGGLDTDSPFGDLTYRQVYADLAGMAGAGSPFDRSSFVEGAGILVSDIAPDFSGYTYFGAVYYANAFGPTVRNPTTSGGGGTPGPVGTTPGDQPTGGTGPSSDPGPGTGGDPGGAPTVPPGVPIPAPPADPAMPTLGVMVPPFEPPADPIGDVPGWDLVETPTDSGPGGDDPGNPGQQVTWQPVPTTQQADRPNAIFAWDVPPRNLKDIDVLDDGDQTVNELLGTGTLLPQDAKWQNEWSAGQQYKPGQYVVKTSGVEFLLRALGYPTIGEDPFGAGSGDWVAIGAVTGGGHYPTGAWDSGHTYVSGDYVQSGGSLWVTHTSGNLNNTPGVKSWMWSNVDPIGGVLEYTGRDETSIGLIGRYWATENFPFATNIATLKLMVDARLKKLRMGAHVITFTPNGLAASLPKPWAEFNLGDTVRVRSSWHLRGGIPQNLTGPFGRPLEVQRMNGFDLDIDDATDAERMVKVYTEEDQG